MAPLFSGISSSVLSGGSDDCETSSSFDDGVSLFSSDTVSSSGVSFVVDNCIGLVDGTDDNDDGNGGSFTNLLKEGHAGCTCLLWALSMFLSSLSVEDRDGSTASLLASSFSVGEASEKLFSLLVPLFSGISSSVLSGGSDDCVTS
eukprot:1203021-Ditylum_brightwellii.AAC.1